MQRHQLEYCDNPIQSQQREHDLEIVLMEDISEWMEGEMEKAINNPVYKMELKCCVEYCTGFRARKEKLAEREKRLVSIEDFLT
jgi:hypothetical protein